jgi:putative membrane protein
MILDAFHGLCMAAADSVPGVSGGTVAFILGFYDRFIDSLHGLFVKDAAIRKDSILYLARLAAGWFLGMAGCVTILSGLFKDQLYFLSSMFLGLTIASIPFIVKDEKESMKKGGISGGLFVAAGAVLVGGLVMIQSNGILAGSLDFAQLSVFQYGYLFIVAMFAITAMVLPGISGSTILLISGVYIPAITAAHQFLKLDFSVLPGILVFAAGILAGIAVSIRFIRNALRKHRPAMVYFITGLMIGSVFAIVDGPRSMGKASLDLSNFSITGFILGFLILFSLEMVRRYTKEENE